MLIAVSDDNRVSKDKSPSPELISLIVQAGDLVERYEHVAYEAKELVKKIKAKAKEEGFGVFEIGLLARTVLKNKFSPNQLTYWFPMPKSNNLPDEITNRTDDVEKELEQNKGNNEPPPETPPPKQNPPPKEPEVEIKEQTDDARVSYWTGQQKENISKIRGLETEIDYINSEMAKLREALTSANIDILSKDKKIEDLEDALRKTEQFRPANQLTEEQARDMTMEVVSQAGLAVPELNEESIFDWIKKRDNGVTCYWYDGYGIELFKSRVLTQLKAKGVTTFRRLYFEV